MASVGYGPLQRIDGPLPVPPPFGLLPAAEAPAAGVRIVVDLDSGETVDLQALRGTEESMDAAIARLRADGTIPPRAGQERWLNGVAVYPYPPDEGELFDTCSAGGSSATKDFGAELAQPEFGAFTGYVAESCKSYKVWNPDEFKARAVVALNAVESSIVARQLMYGEGVALNPHLADGGGVFPNGDTVTNPVNGLALLEQQIGLSGKLGIIHCSPQFASALRERFALDNRTGVIRTINGNVVIADNGYAAASTPSGHAGPIGTQEWIYATGPVDVRRTEIFTMPDNVAEALDRGTADSATNGNSNTYTYRAERYYLVDWDTELQAAVLVDRCQAGCTG